MKRGHLMNRKPTILLLQPVSGARGFFFISSVNGVAAIYA